MNITAKFGYIRIICTPRGAPPLSVRQALVGLLLPTCGECEEGLSVRFSDLIDILKLIDQEAAAWYFHEELRKLLENPGARDAEIVVNFHRDDIEEIWRRGPIEIQGELALG